MPSGHPDGSEGGASTIVTSVGDFGEAVVRLGGIPGIYRTGKAIWVDDFSSGVVPYRLGNPGVAGDFVHDGDLSFIGSSSIKIIDTTAAAGEFTLLKFLTSPPKGKVGVYFAFSLKQSVDHILLRIRLYDGTNLNKGEIRLDPADGQITYLDSDNAFQDLAVQVIPAGTDERYFHIKLVIDLDSGNYDKFILDNKVHSMIDTALRLEANTIINSFRVDVGVNFAGGDNDYIHIDNLVITVDEP